MCEFLWLLVSSLLAEAFACWYYASLGSFRLGKALILGILGITAPPLVEAFLSESTMLRSFFWKTSFSSLFLIDGTSLK